MHVGELAVPECQETLSSYEVAGVSTLLAEQTREKTRVQRRQEVSEKRQTRGSLIITWMLPLCVLLDELWS